MKLFEVTLTEPLKESLKQSWYAGFVLSLSQLLTTANTVAWRGLLYHNEIPYEHLFPTFFILVTTGERGLRPGGLFYVAFDMGRKGGMFRYANGIDMLLMLLGTLGSIGDGLMSPLTMLVLSDVINKYGDVDPSFSIQVVDKVRLDYCLLFTALTLAVLCCYWKGICWTRTSERQTSRMRMEYLKSVLRQEVGFFDKQAASSTTFQVISTISSDAHSIQDVISEKIPNCLAHLSSFIFCLIVAFFLSWRLAVAALPFSLMFIIPGVGFGKLMMNLGMKMKVAYGVAGEIAEQAISSVRTVYSYAGECQTLDRFSHALQKSMKLGIKLGFTKGLLIGSMGTIYAAWAFQAWVGTILVTEKGEGGGSVFISGVCNSQSQSRNFRSIMNALPNLSFILEATAAATRIFEITDRIPEIDSENEKGKILAYVRGEIEFKEVEFSYPSRPTTKILQGFNLKVKAGKTVGLVGGSGSGKSTIISLLERFYDPNILFGKEGAPLELVVRAAKAANAHGFISKLPQGYETQVGQFGIQLSGGQKQRIAIARALIRDPRILLLDEATSALDAESERIVQEALDQASLGRTTIMIAHRLSTIHKADIIVVLQSGRVVESGSHNDLIQMNNGQGGAYSRITMTFSISMAPSIQLHSYDESLIGCIGAAIGWFDQDENTSAAICARLATEANMVRSLIGDRISLLVQVFFTTMEGPKKENIKQSWISGFGLFSSQFLTTASIALTYWYGGRLMIHGLITPKHLSVFAILDRQSKIEPEDPERIMVNKAIKGCIELKNVFFSYPTRPDQMIFKGLSLRIEAGKTAALVGESGSGKSTVIGLIERFYDPLNGSVQIDQHDIRSYNLRKLRSHIALVSQEPILFAGTIYENIVYGKENATEAEIRRAALLANAHEFISSMKDGYKTYCGERGVQLSGGQKQRIALARAILKNPAIILLDEATSALDSMSENLVQEALEKMMVGRTCVVVAHRLSTIQKSDTIAVIKNGKVVEQGSHSDLLAVGHGGTYYSLIKLQGNHSPYR
ncbi:unnamed protein product, partial [Vitis vinifera]